MPEPELTTSHSIKLQAYLAHAGIASRRQSEVLIEAGQVKVNGEVATIGQRIIPGKDKIEYQDKLVGQDEPLVYVLVNKPVGLVSTTSDELHRPTVLSLLPPELRKYRLYPVGRLDQESQGLLLLTNDGDLAYRLTHPKFKVKKTYLVKLDRVPTEPAVEHMRRGIIMKEGKTARAKVDLADETVYEKWMDGDDELWYTVTIHEGRNRQVRRMWERVGYDVQRLIRVSMGPLTLEQLGEVAFKILGEKEVLGLSL